MRRGHSINLLSECYFSFIGSIIGVTLIVFDFTWDVTLGARDRPTPDARLQKKLSKQKTINPDVCYKYTNASLVIGRVPADVSRRSPRDLSQEQADGTTPIVV